MIALVIGTNQKGTFHKTKLYNPKSPPATKQAGFSSKAKLLKQILLGQRIKYNAHAFYETAWVF